MMNVRVLLACAVLVTASMMAVAQVSRQPYPPTQICINNKCSASAAPAVAGSHPIKWHPGHYMGTNSIQQRSDTGPHDPTEFSAMLNSPPQVVGYKVYFYWNALESDKPGVYTFGVLDSLLAQLTAAGKHLVLVVLPAHFSGFGPPPIPAYILNNPATYGPAPAGPWGTTGGWWGSTHYGSAAALHRTAVNNRWVALFQALGARYDSNPNFEAVVVQEDSYYIGAMYGAPDFTEPAWAGNLKTMLSATVAAFPTSNVGQENSWMYAQTPTQQLEDWMMQNRVAAAEADTLGQSYISAQGIASALPWGVAAYLGVQVPGSAYKPMRNWTGTMPYMADVEAPDMGVFLQVSGGPYTPQDILNALNQTYKATHAFWNYLPSNLTSNSTIWWSNLQAFLVANPLLNTAYPPGYPQ